MIVRALKALWISTSIQREIGGIINPYLHVYLLQLLRLLCLRLPVCVEMTSEALAQLLTNASSEKERKSLGSKAVLYECIFTIIAISKSKPLRTLAVTSLLRFFSKRDNNSKYVALSLLGKAAFQGMWIQNIKVIYFIIMFI